MGCAKNWAKTRKPPDIVDRMLHAFARRVFEPPATLHSNKNRRRRCLPQARIDAEKQRLETTRVAPDSAVALAAAEASGQRVPQHTTLDDLLRRPHVHYQCVHDLYPKPA